MIRWLLVAVLSWPSLAFAQSIVISQKPDRVAVTIYRNPERVSDAKLDLDDLQGFAVISETRTVDLPPGVVTVRFEGVASGIVPQSALIYGADVREKNRDAAILSKRGLLDTFTGQQATLKRTDPATGKVTEERVTIRSGTTGVVVQTARGFESVYCTGLKEAMIFPGVPSTLSATPVLSMTTRAQAGGRRTITLVYLASRFDWQANYVGDLAPNGRSIDLFAWLTMASSDDTSFVAAQAAAVAGKVNRSETSDDTADVPDTQVDYACEPGSPQPYPQAFAAPPVMMMRMDGPLAKGAVSDIVVTGTRVATRENLGDLKLYRIPMPVTVAARAQKQVAFLVKPHVAGRLVYRFRPDRDERPDRLFRLQNIKASGLGEALPAGQVAVFQRVAGNRLLVGEASLTDKAEGEDVDLVLGRATNVSIASADTAQGDDAKGHGWTTRALTVRNANPLAVAFEAEFATGDADHVYSAFSGRLIDRPGKRVWVVTVPANGVAVLRYRVADGA